MALTKTPIELSSTPSIVDGGNATAITIDSSENVGIGGAPAAKLDVTVSGSGIAQYVTNTSSSQAYTAWGNSDNPAWSQDFNTPGGLLVGIDSDETAVIYQGGNKALRFGTNATERMRIDSSGNVGLGVVPTTDHNPVVEALQIGSTANLFGRNDAEITTLTSNSYLSVAGYPKYITTNEASEYIQTSGNHIWYNAPSGTAGATCTLTERLRISAQGQLTSNSSADDDYGLEIKNNSSTRPYGLEIELVNGTSNTTQALIVSRSGGNNKFIVWTNGNAQNVNNSYTGLSDLKLKENIVDSGSQWDDLKAVRVRKYSLKDANLDAPNMLGVIAQELEEAGMSGLVDEHPDKDDENNDLGTVTKSVSYSILYMKAIKALQEAMTRIETLEAKVQTLENN